MLKLTCVFFLFSGQRAIEDENGYIAQIRAALTDKPKDNPGDNPGSDGGSPGPNSSNTTENTNTDENDNTEEKNKDSGYKTAKVDENGNNINTKNDGETITKSDKTENDRKQSNKRGNNDIEPEKEASV